MSSRGINSYRDLNVWQLGMQLTKDIYVLTRDFPKHELYGLTSQIRRAAVSVPANLAEGHARDSTKDFMRFVSITRGSMAEVETHLLLAESLGYCNNTQVRPLLESCAQCGRMLSGLKRSLRQKLER
jgi:four helix bundle protein